MRETLADGGRLPWDGSQTRPQASGAEGDDAGCPDPGNRSKLVFFAGTVKTALRRESDSRHGAGIGAGTASPVQYDHTPRVISCEGKEYFVPLTVQCSPGAALSPLLLDFFVHRYEFTILMGRQLDKILKERKVLYQELPGDNWRVMPRTRLRLICSKEEHKIEGKGKSTKATLVRVEVDQKFSVAFGRESPENNRYSWGEQSSWSTIVVRNCSDRTVMVVQTPTDLPQSPDSSDTFDVQLGAEGSTSTCKRNTRTMKIALPKGYEPGCKIMAPGEICEFGVDEIEDTTRLLFCTLEDISDSGKVSGMCLSAEDSESATTSPSITPRSDENVERWDVKTLRVWDSMLAYGGRDIGVLPAFSTGFYLQSATVDGNDRLYLAHCAIALDGNFIPATSTVAPSPSIITAQGRKPRKWGPLQSLIEWLHRTKMN